MLAGCGYQALGTQGKQPSVPVASADALSANSYSVQATHVVGTALGVMRQLRDGSLTATGAKRLLGAGQVALERLARATSQPLLQENLAEASDAFAVFLAVMLNQSVPAYQQALANLTGTLAGFGRVCSDGNPDFAGGISGWEATNASTALSRSAIAHDGQWSLQVTNAGTSPAAAGFTNSAPWAPVTLKGSDQVALWARALQGRPTLTLQVRELSGGSVLGSTQVTMRLDSTFRFESLTYQIRHPGASSLSVTVSAAGLAPGDAFLVDDVTIVRC